MATVISYILGLILGAGITWFWLRIIRRDKKSTIVLCPADWCLNNYFGKCKKVTLQLSSHLECENEVE